MLIAEQYVLFRFSATHDFIQISAMFFYDLSIHLKQMLNVNLRCTMGMLLKIV